jgi:hypothetical protein
MEYLDGMPLRIWSSISAQSSSWEVCVFGDELRIFVRAICGGSICSCVHGVLFRVLKELQISLIYLFSCFWCLDSGLFVRWKQISLFFASFFVFF